MSVPHADSPDHEARSEVQAHVVGRARRPAHPPRAAASAADPQLHLIGAASADALMLAMLTLFNESDDMDGTIQQSLDMLTTALGGRIGEIWLVGGEARQVELRYSSSDGSRAAAAFAAAGRSLAPDTAPALVGRVLRTGRGSTAEVSGGEGSSERAAQAAEAGIRAAIAFPIRTGNGLAGVLAVHRETVERPARGVLDVVPVACHHMGRFLERVLADDAIHESVQELSELASTDSLTGLKNRREFDRALRTIPREPFAILSGLVQALISPVPDRHRVCAARRLTMTSSRIGSRAAMDATMAFARASGAVVIAEGVENEFVADLMKEAGIHFGQGFGLGKPTAADALEDVRAALAGRAALSGLRPRRTSVHAG